MIRAVLFDFDGVICDSESLHFEGFRRVCHNAWQQDFDREFYDRELIGFDDVEGLQFLAGHFKRAASSAEIQSLAQAKAEWLAPRLPQAPLIPGAVETLQQVSALLPWAIVSGALRDEITAVMGHRGLALPGVLVAAGDTEEGKPSPQPYLRAIQQLAETVPGLAPHECVVLEDTRAGVRSGLRAGCHVLHLTAAADPAFADTEAYHQCRAHEEILWDDLERFLAA